MTLKNKKLLCLLFAFFNFNLDSTPSPETLNRVPRVAKAVSVIKRHYYDPSRIHPDKAMKAGLNFLAVKVPEVLVEFPENDHKVIVSIGNHTRTVEFQNLTDLDRILNPIAQSIAFIQQHYRGDINSEEMEYAVINGILETLDPHSNLLTPEIFKEFKTQTTGEYGGIGIVVGIKDDELTVVAPIEGTPASRAGIQTDDKIIQIDSLSTTNMLLSEAVERLRGKVASKVTLQIGRKNSDVREYALIREQISIQSVRSKLVIRDNKRLGVISLKGFQEDTYADMEKALRSMTASQPLNGLVIDLRNNPGGLLEQSLEIADKFLASGEILYTVGPKNLEEEVSKAQKNDGDILNTPIIVLVNGGSASASEIVAGALKNNQRALILGTQTFGKGSVQSLFGLKDDASIKLTMAQYLTPGRVSIQAVGITPDIELMPVHIEKDTYDLKEDESLGEKSLDEHLENQELVRQAKPTYKLQYLDTKKAEKGESDYTLKIDEARDYPLNLALNLLNKVGALKRADMIQKSLPELKVAATSQDKAIEEALKKLGIDWAAGPAPKNRPDLEVTSKFLNKKTNQAVSNLQAGEEIIWQLTVKNRGAEELYRTLGEIKSENPLLDKREFVLGRLKPGATQTAKVTFSIPADMFSVEEMTRVEIGFDKADPVAHFKFFTQFVEKPKPALAYSYSILDNGQEGSVGNGNKIPEKGETISVLVTVKNLSEQPAKDVTANLKNTEGDGIFLKEGRTDIGLIPPKGESRGKLAFKIDPTFPKNAMKIDLSVTDKTTKAGVTDTLSFPLAGTDTARFEPTPASLQIAPVITVASKTFNEATRTLTLSGSATDEQSMGDLMIFAGNKKVFYKAASVPPGASIPFSLNIPLEEGINILSIQARDARKFKSQQTLSVIVGKKNPS